MLIWFFKYYLIFQKNNNKTDEILGLSKILMVNSQRTTKETSYHLFKIKIKLQEPFLYIN